MRRVFLTAILTGHMSLCAVATETQASDQDAITGIIDDQITAFLADDFETAFKFASPGIRGMFGTPERFGRMVREGYPMVWRPSNVEYLDLRQEADGFTQRVMVRDSSGATWLLDYSMIQRPEGWRINGVRLLTAPPTGV
ncbi:MAG: DUF4864 domain-containing protein [Pseudomonadota bacterium]